MSNNELESYILSLLIRRGEIDGFETAIRELLTGCSSSDEFDVIKHVLENVLIIGTDRLARPIKALAERIVDEIVNNGPTAVVAMAYDSSPDSSQMLVQMLKPAMRGQSNVTLLNTVPSYLKKDISLEYTNCILIDEFSGTGRTVKNRIEYIQKDLASKGREGTIKAKVLFGMKEAKDTLESEGIEIEFLQILKAGISGYFNGQERERLTAAMKSIETQLAPDILGKPVPSMGHGDAEAMFNIKGWNAPNSNFPILWWPEDVAGKSRETMMVRYEP